VRKRSLGYCILIEEQQGTTKPIGSVILDRGGTLPRWEILTLLLSHLEKKNADEYLKKSPLLDKDNATHQVSICLPNNFFLCCFIMLRTRQIDRNFVTHLVPILEHHLAALQST